MAIMAPSERRAQETESADELKSSIILAIENQKPKMKNDTTSPMMCTKKDSFRRVKSPKKTSSIYNLWLKYESPNKATAVNNSIEELNDEEETDESEIINTEVDESKINDSKVDTFRENLSAVEPQVEKSQAEELQVEELQAEELQVEEPLVKRPHIEEPPVEELAVEEDLIEELLIEELQIEEKFILESQAEEAVIEELPVREPQAKIEVCGQKVIQPEAEDLQDGEVYPYESQVIETQVDFEELQVEEQLIKQPQVGEYGVNKTRVAEMQVLEPKLMEMHVEGKQITKLQTEEPRTEDEIKKLQVNRPKINESESEKEVIEGFDSNLCGQAKNNNSDPKHELVDEASGTVLNNKSHNNIYESTNNSPDSIIMNSQRTKRKKTVRFADESGGELELVCWESTFSSDGEVEELSRIIILLLSPRKRMFEFVHISYSVSDKTSISFVLKQLGDFTTDKTLKKQKYVGLLRNNEDGRELINTFPIQSYNFSKNEVLVAVVKGCNGNSMMRMASSIMGDKRMMRSVRMSSKVSVNRVESPPTESAPTQIKSNSDKAQGRKRKLKTRKH